MNIVLLEPGELGADRHLRLAGPRAAHLVNVLDVKPGQTVRVGVLEGPRGLATVESVGATSVLLRCDLEAEPPARPRVDLLLALPRPKVMRRLWAQLAALGVSRIVLTNAARVERPYFDTHVLAPECYTPLLIEGLQQARDTRLPQVSIHRQFKVLVEDELDAMSDAVVRLVADPGADARAGEAVRSGLEGNSGARVLLAVGPEGGWNAFELRLLDAHGFRHIGMGPRTLRTDTACLALLALVHDALA
ncbi:MAG: 16S rRNA (uracil(1498)-N(3))-methyltransferase [Vicinamibacteria bacterium]|nr:16S rRNA (uracil(1498)-N(3))-methyltransferase [Vicinamibacteria bacterium]